MEYSKYHKEEFIKNQKQALEKRKKNNLYNISLVKYRVSLLAEIALLLEKTKNKKPYKKLVFRAKKINNKLPFWGGIYTHLQEGKDYRKISDQSDFFENDFSDYLINSNLFYGGKYMYFIEKRQYQKAYNIAFKAAREINEFL